MEDEDVVNDADVVEDVEEEAEHEETEDEDHTLLFAIDVGKKIISVATVRMKHVQFPLTTHIWRIAL